MTWFTVLKEISLLEDNQLRNKLPNFQTAQEKGYPPMLDNLTFVAELSEGGEVMAYTAYMDFGRFYFVGNGQSVPKFKGSNSWRKVISARDAMLNKPKITLLNPKGSTSLSRLHSTVINRGWSKVESYADVEDIMSEPMFTQFSVLPMYRGE